MSRTALRRGLPVVGLLVAAGCAQDREGIADPSVAHPSIETVRPLAGSAGVCDYDPDEAALTGPGWTKVFDEAFSGDLSRWSIWTGGAFNEELQLYQAGNLQTGNGLLSITARKETVTGPTTPFDPTPKTFAYTSGRIESGTHFSASNATPKVRFSARLRLPAGYGMWPAFWSYGDPWPTQGEIDIVEARGQEPFQYQTAYWYGRRPGQNLVRSSESVIQSSVSLTDCWHVYEVIWTKSSLTFLFDGQVVDVKSGGYIPSFYRKQQRLTLNLAVGGLFFPNLDPAAIQTGTLEADWVKAFTSR